MILLVLLPNYFCYRYNGCQCVVSERVLLYLTHAYYNATVFG